MKMLRQRKEAVVQVSKEILKSPDKQMNLLKQNCLRLIPYYAILTKNIIFENGVIARSEKGEDYI